MRWWIFGALFGLVVVFVFVGEHGNLVVAQSRPGQQQQTVDGHTTDGIAQLGWYLFSVGTGGKGKDGYYTGDHCSLVDQHTTTTNPE